ncbi:Arc family DNA-binding protein [Candidatus Latescibacterota bacterium]
MSKRKSVLLRIDPGLWSELNRWAQDELRSLNGQIEYVLRDAVRKRKKDRSDGGGAT